MKWFLSFLGLFLLSMIGWVLVVVVKNDVGGGCFFSANYPYYIKMLGPIKCGYLYGSDEKITSTYLGKAKGVYVRNNRVFMKLFLGKGVENVFLGNLGTDDFLSIVNVSNSAFRDEKSNGTDDRYEEKVFFGGNAVDRLKILNEKYIILTSSRGVGSKEQENQIKEDISKLSKKDRKNIENLFGFVKRCSGYNDAVEQYYFDSTLPLFNKVFSSMKLQIGRLMGCYLYVSNVMVYD